MDFLKPRWRISFGSPRGDGNNVFVETYYAPNRFHRFMQKILLGIYWQPIKNA